MSPSLSDNPARVKRLLIALLVMVAVIVTFLAIRQSGRGTLALVVVPSDASIVTSQGAKLKDGSNTLAAGKYTVTITRAHFLKQTFSFEIKGGQTVTRKYGLGVADAAGLQYYRDHPDEKAIADGITGQNLDAIAIKVAQEQPLVRVLPVQGLNWRIDAGQSKKYPNDPTKVAIYITGPDTTSQNEALNWISDNGYRASDYEIIYQDLAAYNQQVNPGTSLPSSFPGATPAPSTFTPDPNQDYN